MDLNFFKNKLIAILGCGMEGKATAQYLKNHGLSPVLFDQKPVSEWDETELAEIKALGLNFIFGPDCFMELVGFDIAFRSPGIKPYTLNLIGKGKNGLQITSQSQFFFDNCPSKIIGITGTKGKGTSSALIYEILKNDFANKGRRVYLTGNIGKTQPLEILDRLKADDVVVFELSSFQLADMHKSPHIAVVLMVTSEHLDYHNSTEDYVLAKSSITNFQNEHDYAIINADFENSRKIGGLGNAKKLYFSTKKVEGLDCVVNNGFILAPGYNLSLPINSLRLRVNHNLENVCAAVLGAKLAGAENQAIKTTVANFAGLEHRLEFVCEKQGIKFFNDSFSTTPETAVAAIKSFNEPLIVILGGSSKKSNFEALGRAISATKNLKAVILVGNEAARIEQAIEQAIEQPVNFSFFRGANNMPEIFAQIKQVAKAGDVVLLSPACASFGMFKNYQERGNLFKQYSLQWQ